LEWRKSDVPYEKIKGKIEDCQKTLNKGC